MKAKQRIGLVLFVSIIVGLMVLRDYAFSIL
jgi:hypothetical protein